MFIKDEEMKGKVPRFSKQLWQALSERSSPFFGKDACTFCTQAFTPGSVLVNAQLYQNLVKSISHEPGRCWRPCSFRKCEISSCLPLIDSDSTLYPSRVSAPVCIRPDFGEECKVHHHHLQHHHHHHKLVALLNNNYQRTQVNIYAPAQAICICISRVHVQCSANA